MICICTNNPFFEGDGSVLRVFRAVSGTIYAHRFMRRSLIERKYDIHLRYFYPFVY